MSQRPLPVNTGNDGGNEASIRRRAEAAIAHCHARDPVTGKGSREVSLYREVVARIRESGTDVVINLTAGMGGGLFIGPDDRPTDFGEDTDLGCRSWRCWAAIEPRPGASASPWSSTAIWGCIPSGCAPRSKASSLTACGKPCGANSFTW